MARRGRGCPPEVDRAARSSDTPPGRAVGPADRHGLRVQDGRAAVGQRRGRHAADENVPGRDPDGRPVALALATVDETARSHERGAALPGLPAWSLRRGQGAAKVLAPGELRAPRTWRPRRNAELLAT